MVEFRVLGRWWLPGSPEMQLPGVLTFDSGGAHLELDGSFPRRPGGGSWDEARRYPRVQGEAAGQAYNIEDCFQTGHRSSLRGSRSIEEIYGNRVVRGAGYFDDDEPLTGNRAVAGLSYLNDWIGRSGLEEQWGRDHDPAEVDPPNVTIQWRATPEQQIQLEDGRSVRLLHGLHADGHKLRGRRFSPRYSWEVEASVNVPVDDLVEVLGHLQDLVSLGTHRAAAFEGLTFFNSEITDDELPEGAQQLPLELIANWRARAEPADDVRYHHQLIFSFDDIGGIDGVARWLPVAERYARPLRRAMATRYGQGMLLADRFSNRVAALESFDQIRTGKRERNLAKRLIRCAELAGAPFGTLVPDIATWCEMVRIERNDIAHELGMRDNSSRRGSLLLLESIHWLFVLCLLREAGADAAATRLDGHPELQWVREGLAAL